MSLNYYRLDSIQSEMFEMKKLLLEIKNANNKDYNLIYYTYQEAATLFKVEYQTILNYVKVGKLKAQHFGGNCRIHHFEIFNEDFSIKKFKHKRKA